MQIFSRMDGWIWGVYFFQPRSVFQIYQIWINWSNQSDDCIWQQVHWQLKACISTEHTIIWNSPMFYLSHIWDQSENISLPPQICTKAVVTKLQVLHQTMNFSLQLDSMNQESSVSYLETWVPAHHRLMSTSPFFHYGSFFCLCFFVDKFSRNRFISEHFHDTFLQHALFVMALRLKVCQSHCPIKRLE